MTERTTIFECVTGDDFTLRSIEIVKYTYEDRVEYLLKIHETFEKDINGETESLSSITLMETEAMALTRTLYSSVFGVERVAPFRPYAGIDKEVFRGEIYGMDFDTPIPNNETPKDL